MIENTIKIPKNILKVEETHVIIEEFRFNIQDHGSYWTMEPPDNSIQSMQLIKSLQKRMAPEKIN